MKKIYIIYMVLAAQALLTMEQPETALILSSSANDKVFTKFRTSVLKGDVKYVRKNIDDGTLATIIHDEACKKEFGCVLEQAKQNNKQSYSFKDYLITAASLGGSQLISFGISVLSYELMCSEEDSIGDPCFWKSTSLGIALELAGIWYGLRYGCKTGVFEAKNLRKATCVSSSKIQDYKQVYKMLNTFAQQHNIQHNNQEV